MLKQNNLLVSKIISGSLIQVSSVDSVTIPTTGFSKQQMHKDNNDNDDDEAGWWWWW